MKTCTYVFKSGPHKGQKCPGKHSAKGLCRIHYQRKKGGFNMDALPSGSVLGLTVNERTTKAATEASKSVVTHQEAAMMAAAKAKSKAIKQHARKHKIPVVELTPSGIDHIDVTEDLSERYLKSDWAKGATGLEHHDLFLRPSESHLLRRICEFTGSDEGDVLHNIIVKAIRDCGFNF